MSEDCYFFIDVELPEEKQHPEALCVECHNKDYPPEFGWLWKGSEFGYGPWELLCCICKKKLN